MSDIARKVGLGRSTVSMALRNHPEIAVATRERVVKAATELGYQPNPLISLLMSRLHEESTTRRDTVIAVVSEPHDNWVWRTYPVFKLMWSGMEEQATRRGYLIEEFSVGPHGLPPARLAQILRARGIPGVILAPKLNWGPSAFVGWDDFACVALNWSASAPDLPRASFDCFRNFNRAWAALEARGYRRIGFMDHPDSGLRIAHQYQAANLIKLNLLPAERRITPLAIRPEVLTAKVVRDWLDREQPDAVLVSDAAYMVRLLREASDVPTRVAIGALELANAPAGTAGIDERVAETGAAAVDMIIGRLQRNERGLPEAPRTLEVAGIWRDGDTARHLPA